MALQYVEQNADGPNPISYGKDVRVSVCGETVGEGAIGTQEGVKRFRQLAERCQVEFSKP